MPRLAVNIDHVATLRQARKTYEPDPVAAAALAEIAGAQAIIVHLREDRRHIQDRDVRLLRQTVASRLNLEMAATEEIIGIAVDVKPDMVTLVPEKRQELTTEGGLDVAGRQELMKDAVDRFKAAGIRVSMFVDPDSTQILASKKVGADIVEIHTGRYAETWRTEEGETEFSRIAAAAKEAYSLGLDVSVGHGLTYQNVMPFPAIREISEYSIGHSIMARAILVGLDRAVKDMIALINMEP